MRVQLLTLGRFAILADGVERDSFLAQPTRSAVLLYLALERETTREAAMAVFWPERNPDAARHALSQTLHKLRRDLGEESIQARGERLRIAPWMEVDARTFETAARRGEWASALDLYRGPFLHRWILADVTGFEHWVDERRARLGRLYREAAQAHINERLSAGDAESAVATARRWTNLEPLETEPQYRLIELLAGTGRSTEAIRVYEDYVRRAAAEELEPSAEIAALVRDIPATPTPLSSSLPTDVQPVVIVPQRRSGRRGIWLLASVLVAAMALLLFVTRPGLMDGGQFASDRVLVLPLRNLTGDPELDGLGTMGADWIVDGLSRVGVVRVVPLTEVLRSAGQDEDGPSPADIGRTRELAADARAGTVVTGSYGRNADELVFQAQVVSVDDGTLLGTVEPIHTSMEAPLSGIDELRQGVTGILAVRLDPQLSERYAGLDAGIPPPRYDAYRAYTDGLAAFLQQEYADAVPLLLRAAEIDSSFTRPLLLAATGLRVMGDYAHADSLITYLSGRAGSLTPYEAGALQWHQAKLAADADALLRYGREVTELFPGTAGQFVAGEDALQLHRPRLALGYFEGLDTERGWTRDHFPLWDHMASAYHSLAEHDAELRIARQARASLPASACPLRTEVRALAALGRLEAVGDAIGRSLELRTHADCSPGDVMLVAALELRAHGHSGEARRLATRAIGWFRSRPAGQASGAAQRAALAQALYLAGRLDEAESLLQLLAAEDPADVGYLGRIGVMAARRRDVAEALRVDSVLASRDGRFLYGSHLAWRARIAATLGDEEQAVTFLRDAFSQGLPWTLELHTDPDLEGLADYPPFLRLFEPKG